MFQSFLEKYYFTFVSPSVFSKDWKRLFSWSMLKLPPYCGEGMWNPKSKEVSNSSISAWEQRGESKSASPTFSRHGAKVHTRKANVALNANSNTYGPVLWPGKVFSCSGLQFPHLKQWDGNDSLTQSSINHQVVDMAHYPARQKPSSWTASELFPFNLNLSFFFNAICYK